MKSAAGFVQGGKRLMRRAERVTLSQQRSITLQCRFYVIRMINQCPRNAMLLAVNAQCIGLKGRVALGDHCPGEGERVNGHS